MKNQFLLVLLLISIPFQSWCQDYLQGHFLDLEGEVLIGSNISIEGTSTTIAVTDIDGAYRLKLPNRDLNLRYAYDGHCYSVLVAPRNASKIDVIIKEYWLDHPERKKDKKWIKKYKKKNQGHLVLSGQLMDQDNQPMPNARLFVKGKKEQYIVSTDAEGRYLINAPFKITGAIFYHQKPPAEIEPTADFSVAVVVEYQYP